MTSDRLDLLEMRLAEVERELALVRSHNIALTRAARRSKRMQIGLISVMFAVIGLSAAFFYTPHTAEAQTNPQVLTVKAPFTVVDDQGKRVMRVVAGEGEVVRGLSIFNSQDQLALQATVNKKGAGGFIARNPNIGGGGGNGIIYDEATNEPLIGGRGPDSKIRYEIGPKGISFNNASGNGVTLLGPASDNTGRLTLANANGDTVFEAGTYPNGYGFARAYPIGGKMPLPVPWYIMGQPK